LSRSGVDPDEIEDFRKIGKQGCSPSCRSCRGDKITSSLVHRNKPFTQPINLPDFLVVTIVAQLILDIEQDEQTASHPNGQASDVDEGVTFMFEQISGSDFEVVFEQDELLMRNS